MSFRHVNAFGRLVLEDESSVQRGEPSAAVAPGLFLDNLRDVLTPSKLNGILPSAGWRIRGRSEWQSRAIPLSVVTDELDLLRSK
jgi:hypothetical protein